MYFLAVFEKFINVVPSINWCGNKRIVWIKIQKISVAILENQEIKSLFRYVYLINLNIRNETNDVSTTVILM